MFCSILLNSIINYLAYRLEYFYLNNKTFPEIISKNHKNAFSDELEELQTKQSIILRGARLIKMLNHMLVI
jgi:hypothetical protein